MSNILKISCKPAWPIESQTSYTVFRYKYIFTLYNSKVSKYFKPLTTDALERTLIANTTCR